MNPDTYTIQEFHIDVGDGHKLYVQDWGKKDAKQPILFLHGGPGSEVKDKHKDVFNPKKQRVIFFDQRGCGQSTPAGSLKDNTTDKLVDDMIKILDHMKVNEVILTGGSWASCLALVFGVRHPNRVAAMILDGILTGAHEELSWVDNGGFQAFFPDVWQKYLDSTPKEHWGNPSAYHFARATGTNKKAAKESAYAYECMEYGILQLDDRITPENFDDYDPAGIQIEMYYLGNKCFLPDNYVFDNASKLTMPIYMVQGRYDAVCPPKIAWKLHNMLPKSELIWTIGGHHKERESWNVVCTLLSQLSA